MRTRTLWTCIAAALAACGDAPAPSVSHEPHVATPAVAPRPSPRPSPEPVATSGTGAAPAWRADERTWGGVVVDLRGRPVAGARAASGGREATTSAEGGFLLTQLPPRRAELLVTAPGFARTKLVAWPGREDLRIVLPRQVRVTGIVVHPDGRPAEGARVNHAATTGADGRFEVPLEEGTHNVFVQWGVLPGTRDETAAYGNVWLDVDPADPPRDVRVVADDVCSWVGVVVTGPDGKPAEATVWYAYEDRRFGLGTGSTGESSFSPSIPPGTEMELLVEPAERSGLLPATVRVRTLPGVGERARVALSAGGGPSDPRPLLEFPVRVVDAAGNDVPDVRFHDAAVDERCVVRERPGPDGTVRIRVAAPGFVGGDFRVAVDPLQPSEVRLALVRAGHVAVTVTDPAYASRELTVRVADPGGGADALATIERGRSDVVVRDVSPGDAVVMLHADDDDAPEWWRTVRVEPGGTTPVVCDAVCPAPLRGRVVGGDGRPLGGVGIDVRPRPKFGGRFDDAATCTAADGTFELPAIDADAVHLGARRDDMAPAWLRFEPRPGGVAELRMTPGGRVRFLLRPEDFVASDAWLHDAGGAVALWAGVVHEPQGDRVIEHVPAGRWSVRYELSHAPRVSVIDVREGETTDIDVRE